MIDVNENVKTSFVKYLVKHFLSNIIVDNIKRCIFLVDMICTMKFSDYKNACDRLVEKNNEINTKEYTAN